MYCTNVENWFMKFVANHTVQGQAIIQQQFIYIKRLDYSNKNDNNCLTSVTMQ